MTTAGGDGMLDSKCKNVKARASNKVGEQDSYFLFLTFYNLAQEEAGIW
jgi:hypothetical protein